MRGTLNMKLQSKPGTILLGILVIFLFSVFRNAKIMFWSSPGNQLNTMPNSRLNPTLEDSVMAANHTRSTSRHPLIPPYPYAYKFTINQPDKCKDEAPFLVMLVILQAKDIGLRNVIRRTWANESNVPGVSILRLFVTAASNEFNTTIQDMLEEESKVYQDIIQQDFLDTYNNLTLKTLMGMEWVAKHCPDASYVMKIDSDVFLNVNYLVHNLLKPELPVRKNYISGYVVPNAGVFRSKDSKHYVPKEVYPKERYPPYCSGPGYVFSADMAKKIYDVAQTIQLIHMEDAFVGICLEELKITITKPPNDLFMWQHLEYDRCRFRTLITVHPYSPEKLLNMWQDLQSNHNAPCPGKRK